MSTAERAPKSVLDRSERTSRRRVLGWAMWDWGAQPFDTVITTFVFSVYITSDSFGSENYTSTRLAWATGISGLAIALIAPVLGQNADRTGTMVRNLRIQTWALAAVAAALYFVRPEPQYLWLGLGLLGVGTFISGLASVNYNATIEQVATKDTVGRVSGFGWGMGYLGGIIVLLLVYFLFIQPDEGLFGVTGTDGLDVRAAMVACAIWIVVFTLPAFMVLRDSPVAAKPRLGLAASYRAVWYSIRNIWRTSRQTAYFLLSSALFRDGLAGVFTFGAVLAARTFGLSDGEVIIFGAAANILAGFSTMAFGLLDDRIGPRAVIIFSLVGLVTLGLILFVLHDGGKTVFWTFGLAMTALVGPAQAASRSFLTRLIPEGMSGEIFGLYATTGRAVSFLAPTAFGLFVSLGAAVTGSDQTQYWGILGIALILLAGLAVMFKVKSPDQITVATARQND